MSDRPRNADPASFAPLVQRGPDPLIEVDGRRLLIRSVPHPVHPDGAVLALRDVTDRAALREEVEGARRMGAVTRLAGTIAHEINNPLTVLQLRTDLLLEEGTLPGPFREQVAVLRDSASRIARTVRTLQRIGRPVVSAPEWIAVDDLVQAAVAASRGWTGAGRVEVDPVPPVGVRGDPEALALALEQILAHACDPNGGRVLVTVAQGYVQVDVTTEVARWSAGSVVDPSTTPNPPDRMPALGLTVASTIVHEHGGELRSVLTPPRGGALRIRLPLAPRSSGLPIRRARVLVVDDEPMIGAVVGEWARRAGHEVLVSDDAGHAMRLLGADEGVDLVLADHHLPGGTELLDWVARFRPALRPRFAWMCDEAPPAVPEVAHLLKPLTRGGLAELMDRLLRR